MRPRWELVPPLTTLLVGVLLVIGTRAVWPQPACSASEVAGQGTPQGGDGTVHVVVLSSSNKGPLMAEMACRFERMDPTVAGEPLDIVIESEPSGSAIDKIGELEPDVWAPASTSWVKMLAATRSDLIPTSAGSWPSIAQSPQVIAMPQPIAEKLGWPDATISWRDVLAWATIPGQWRSAVGSRWGDFKLGKTNPLYSTSGLNATVATFSSAAGTASSDLTKSELTPSVVDSVKGVDSAVVHYAPTSLEFLDNLRAQDDLGNGDGYVSAVLLEEKSVWDYNQGNPSGDPATLGDRPPPKIKLRAFHPADGALVADHPYVTLTAPWVTDAERTGARSFLHFLLAPDQQHRFQALGFRNHEGEPGSEINEQNGLIAQAPAPAQPPAGGVLRQIRKDWPRYRKRARVLLLVDVSGSMQARLPGTKTTYLELAKTAAQQALNQLGPDDEVGLWSFSPDSSSAYVENVSIDALSHDHRVALSDAIEHLQAVGKRTALYATLEAAARTMNEGFDPTKINGIIVLSDGINDDAANDEGAMLDAITSTPDREVRIFTIAYGATTADVDTLSAIARSSLGTAYDATDPTTINAVFEQVVANF